MPARRPQTEERCTNGDGDSNVQDAKILENGEK